jgi:hypothetical protein
MGKGGVGVMRGPVADDGAEDSGDAAAPTAAEPVVGGRADDDDDAGVATAEQQQHQGEDQIPAPQPGYDEASLYNESGRLVANLEMFRDDQFVQDKIMPLRHVPLLTPRSEEALRRQGLLVEEIMPHFGPAYSIDASMCVRPVALAYARMFFGLTMCMVRALLFCAATPLPPRGQAGWRPARG